MIGGRLNSSVLFGLLWLYYLSRYHINLYARPFRWILASLLVVVRLMCAQHRLALIAIAVLLV